MTFSIFIIYSPSWLCLEKTYIHPTTKKSNSMKAKYLLWHLALVDRTSIIIDEMDDSNCIGEDCHDCERIKSCNLLQQFDIPVNSWITEYNDYNEAKCYIAEFIHDEQIISIFLLKIDTCIGYICKGWHDQEIFLRDFVPLIQKTYTYGTNNSPLVINTIEDLREYKWNDVVN